MAVNSSAMIRQAASSVQSISGLTKAQASFIQFEPSIAIVASHIERLGLDIRSFREPLKRAVKEVIIPSIRKNFESGGRPTWDSLSPETVTFKTKHGFTEQPLIRTGNLSRVSTQLNIWKINEKAAVITDLPANVFYGKIHQAGFIGSGAEGSKKGWAARQASLRNALRTGTTMKQPRRAPAIPARPFLVLQEQDKKDIERVFEKWLKERMDANWHKGLR